MAVTDAQFGVGQPMDGEVLAKLPVRKIGAAKLAHPVAVRIQLVHHYRTVRASVAAQVSLAVAIDVEASYRETAVHWIFPDAGVNDFAAPGNIAGKTDVERNKACWQCPSNFRPRLRKLD